MSRQARIPTGPGDLPLRPIELGDGQSSINQRQLRRVGLAGWQPATTAALLAAWELGPEPGVFLDVGANAGLYALLCRLLSPATRAIAFEPFPDTVAAGRRWAQANGVEVHFEQLAVSDADGHATLYVSERSDASNSLVAGFRRASATVDVRCVTLDHYLAREGLVPTVIKIDVEQHEPAVIRGADATLRRHRPVVVMELLETDASRQAHQRLRALGYTSCHLGARDHLYWPGGLPDAWQERFDGWLHAVSRCGPVPASRGPARRRRARWPRRAVGR